jgi:hypothetical protein
MDDNTQAQKAIDELHECEYDGKVINVNVAKPKTDRPSGGSGYSRGGGRGGNSGGGYNSERRSSRY